MADEELDYLEELERLKRKREGDVKKLRIILAKEEENKTEERILLEKIIKKERAGGNPVRIKEYVSEAIKMGEERYKMIGELKKHMGEEKYAFDRVKEEIETKKIISTRSSLNEERITEKKKEKKWQGRKNE